MRTIGKAIAVAVAALTLSGCSLFAKHECSAKIQLLDVKTPPALELEVVNWSVVTPANAQEKFEALKRAGLDPVFFAMSEKEFEKQALGDQEVQGRLYQYHDQVIAIDTYYRNLYGKVKEEDKKRWWHSLQFWKKPPAATN